MMQKLKNFLKRILPPPVRTFIREITALREEQRKLEQKIVVATAKQNEQVERITNQFADLKSFQEVLLRHLQQITDMQRIADKTNCESQVRLSQLIEEANREMSVGIYRIAQCVETNYGNIDSRLSNVTENQSKYTERLEKAISRTERSIPNRIVFWTDLSEKEIVSANWGNVTENSDFEEKFLRLIRGLDGRSAETIIRILSRQQKYLNSDNKMIDLFTRAEQEELRLLKENFYDEILKISDNLYAYKNYLLPIKHFESSVFYYKHGLGDLVTLQSVKGKDIVDVGGYIGDSVLVLSELEPRRIYTFESVPKLFELLEKTVEINNVSNVIAENIALGETTGITTMHVRGSASTAIDRPGITYEEDIQVPVTTLDEYVEENNLDIGLIKVDIEGGEPGFLAGAKKTICEQKPILLLSIYHNAHDFFEIKPLIESWNLGYTFKIHKPTYGNTTSETLLLAEVIE